MLEPEKQLLMEIRTRVALAKSHPFPTEAKAKQHACEIIMDVCGLSAAEEAAEILTRLDWIEIISLPEPPGQKNPATPMPLAPGVSFYLHIVPGKDWTL